MISTVTHPRLGEVTLSRTRRARRISISVRGTGAVRVSFPYGVSVRRAMEFLDLKADWVEQARVRMAARMPVEPPLSPRFHALVDRMVGGNEKALNRELRAFAIR